MSIMRRREFITLLGGVAARYRILTDVLNMPMAVYVTGGCPAFLLNIEKRSLPRLMLSGDGLASNDAV